MFMVKDQLCDGTQWHVRTVPAQPAVDPYFPIGQAELRLFEEAGKIRVALRTLTPNFKRYEIQIDGKGWNASGDTCFWAIHDGQNRLEARTLNKFGVTGPISTAVLDMGK
jgi:hypothetical protein